MSWALVPTPSTAWLAVQSLSLLLRMMFPSFRYLFSLARHFRPRQGRFLFPANSMGFDREIGSRGA